MILTGSPAVEAALEDWQLSAAGGVNVVLLSALILGACALLVWTWITLDPGYSLRLRLLLVSLRTLAATLLICLLLQPTLQKKKSKPLPARVAFLFDVSKSMIAKGTHSRLERSKEIVEAALEKATSELEDTDLSFYVFADHLQEIPTLEALEKSVPPSEGTDILGALKALEDIHGGSRLAGVILISDGAQGAVAQELQETTPPQDSEDPIPVNTVSVGTQEVRPDLAVTSARVDPFAFTRSETPIQVSVKCSGMDMQEVEVTLWHDGAVLQRRKASIIGKEGKVTFTITPEARGRRVLSVSVPIPPSDRVPENNTAHVAFDVVRDKYRVLHLAGQPSWDQRFLRQTLEEWPKIDLVSFYVLRTPYQSSNMGSSGLALIPFPTKDLFQDHLQEFDVIILQDFDPAAVGVDRYSKEIARFVKDGGGLILLGGERSYGSPALNKKPLSDVLPFELLPPGTPRRKLENAQVFRPRFTSAGSRHPIVKKSFSNDWGDGDQVSLPKLDGFVNVGGIAPGGIVLMDHRPTHESERSIPIMAVREVEKGRSLAVATDSLWRWRFTAPMTGQLTETYTDLWRTTLSWLTREPELDLLRVSASPADPRQGDPVAVRVEMFDESYAPLPAKELTLAVSWIDDQGIGTTRESEIRLDENGRFYREIETEGLGPHSIVVSSGDGDTARTDILVTNEGSESLHMEPRPEFLAQLSQKTEGAKFTDQLDLSDIALKETASKETISRVDLPLWDHPAALVLLLALIGTEWFIRRRRGLS